MKIVGMIDVDTVNYKKISATIMFPYCSFKCDKENGQPVCQNSALAESPKIEIMAEEIVERYMNNPITEALVLQGLEPIDSWHDMYHLLQCFREQTDDDIVIYTGYTEEELENDGDLIYLKKIPNLIIKFGRYIPNQTPHYDEILGINLASDNQYAKKIS